MKIEKLPSGSYRIRKTYKGKTYTVITEQKPNQKQALQMMSEEMDRVQTKRIHMTFKQSAESYMDVKKNVLSPSTIVNYRSILRNLSEDFTSKLISDITTIDIQKEINDYASTRSAKSVRNAHGFISAVFGMFRPNMNISTTLPQKSKKEAYLPSDEDVKRIINYYKGTEYEIPLRLAALGLRRSEICALSPADLDGNMLTINKAKVVDDDDDNEYLIKDTTKTPAGSRTIYIPDSLADMIRNQGYIYKHHPNNIRRKILSACDALGIPRFSLHKFRHYYASASHSLGVPDQYIMAAGGWKSDSTLKSVYRHAMKDKNEEMQKFASEYIFELIDD